MKLLSRVFAFYINSSIHVAVSVAAITCITLLEYNLSLKWKLLGFVFFGALTGYNFVKYAKIAGLHHPDLAKSLKVILIFSAICLVPFIYFTIQLPFDVFLLSCCFGLPTFFYAIPIVRHKSLRSLAGVKIFVVALVWSGVTVFVPVVNSDITVSADVILTFFQRMLIVVVLIFPFEIRDLRYDSMNLKTLPQQIGVWNTKFLGEVILLLCLVLEFFKETAQMAYIISILVFSIVLSGMLIASRPNQKRYFSSFWIEGLPMLWLVIYLLFR